VAALAPAVAAVRLAVRRTLNGHSGPVLVACSGGPDSLALAAATAFVAPRLSVPYGLITVDHGLQPGSSERAAAVVDWAAGQGFDPAVAAAVDVGGRTGGPEAAARSARYEAVTGAARAHGAKNVLLGHTRDDQAETVLLALLRGSGPRGLAGMPAVREVGGIRLVRPLLDVSRAQTRAACAALDLTPWDDPHNHDPAFTRTRARALLATLADALGPAVVANLARTAQQVGRDGEVLDGLAATALAGVRDRDGSLSAVDLAEVAPAVRTRALHAWARSLGVPGSDLSHRHVDALDALLTDWHGQGAVHLPGAITVRREGWRLRARRRTSPNAATPASSDR
jgi:tRNA(Ile)-lysidine synthase